MPYRAPELFNVESYGIINEKIDIWVSFELASMSLCGKITYATTSIIRFRFLSIFSLS